MSGRRVLVTGASGFIGRWAVTYLIEAGVEVHALTVGEPADPARAGLTWHQADLHDARAVEAVMNTIRPSHLLHAAWYVEPQDYLTSLENLRWVGTTLDLADAFRRCGGHRMVGVGTSAEYGPAPAACRERDTPLAPATLYATCKRSVHDVLTQWSAQTGVAVGWGRVFNLYGPGEAPARLVPQLVRAGVTGTPFPMRFPAQRRDYMHVADVGRALAIFLNSDVQGAVNIASGDAVALRDLAHEVGQCLGAPIALGEAARDPDPAPTVVADVTRLRGEVGFTPRWSLAEGLADSVAWWREWWKAHRDPVLT